MILIENYYEHVILIISVDESNFFLQNVGGTLFKLCNFFANNLSKHSIWKQLTDYKMVRKFLYMKLKCSLSRNENIFYDWIYVVQENDNLIFTNIKKSKTKYQVN